MLNHLSSPTFPRPSAFGPTRVDDRIASAVPFCHDDDTKALVLDFLPDVGGGATVADPRSRERVRVSHALLDWALSAGKS